MTNDVSKALKEHRLIFIIRAATPDHVAELIDVIWEAGGRFAEITLNTPGALEILADLSTRIPAGKFLGAGTVCTVDDVARAANAGVSFVVTPVASEPLVAQTRAAGLAGIIGGSTPTEIYNAHAWGADFVKVFPATSPDYVKTVRGPLPQVPLIAVGGVTKENAMRYLRAGCVAVAVGSSSLHMQPDGSFDHDEVYAAVRAMVRVCELTPE
jgi:2-dehydro-3-deoxyphosphogluconate aldolase/(4S)-4-hydroxy-2-oxoglutarate aldolase